MTNTNKNKTQQPVINKPLGQITKNDPLIPIQVMYSKHLDTLYKRSYLKIILKIYNFNVEELATKWKTDIHTIYSMYVKFRVPVFNDNFKLGNEVNDLLITDKISNKEIRKRLLLNIETYGFKKLLEYYDFSSVYLNILHSFDIGETYENIKPKKELTKETVISIIYDSDVLNKHNYKIELKEDKKEEEKILPMAFIEEDETKIIDNVGEISTMLVDSIGEIKPMSIITFLSFPYYKRKAILWKLIYGTRLNNLEVEKILGVPSDSYLRKLKVRHLMFDFHAIGKFSKWDLHDFKNFSQCQNFVAEILSYNKYYTDYKITEHAFKKFAKEYFDISYSKAENVYYLDSWETFCNKITKQAIYCYKKQSRATNLTEEEVKEFEEKNRRIIPTNELKGLARSVILYLYKNKQSWISIFDFKTEIEKLNYELESNEQLISIIDDLIEKESFKNDNFTLKRLTMENPVLSDDSSVRWEYVTLRPKEEINAEKEKRFEEMVQKMLAEEDKKIIEEKKDKKSFILNNTLTVNVNSENIDDIMNYLRKVLVDMGDGIVNISLNKQ